jgi:hypothetical protein
VLRTALAAFLALALVAGCGGDERATGSAANVAPASAAAFVALDTDLAGDQWQAVDRLLRRFPATRGGVPDLLSKLEGDGLDFERDVRPALGPEVDVVVIDARTAVLLTQPADAAKFRALVERHDGVAREIDGWWVAAESEAALDRFEEGRADGSLADEDAYADPVGELPEQALATAWADPQRLMAAAQQGRGRDEAAAIGDCLRGGESTATAFALVAEDGGVRVRGVARAAGEAPEGVAGTLADELPGGELAYLGLYGLGERLREVLRCAADRDEEVARQIAMVEFALGLSLEEDVLPILARETAVVVYPGPPTGAHVVLAAELADEAAARRTLARVVDRASAFLDTIEVRDVLVGSRPNRLSARRVRIEGEGELFYAIYDGKLVVSPTAHGVAKPSLVDDAAISSGQAYRDATETANAPDDPEAIAFANGAETLAWTLRWLRADEGGATANELANLEPLRSLLLWSKTDGDWTIGEGFLSID